MKSSSPSWNPQQIASLAGAVLWGVVEVVALARWRCAQWLRSDRDRWWHPGA
jgi:hypothetical protein